MNLLIPINTNQTISSIQNHSAWVLVCISSDNSQNISFYDKKEDIQELVDYIIVPAKEESLRDFVIEGIAALVAPMQKSIDDIIEAFMFRELHEVNV